MCGRYCIFTGGEEGGNGWGNGGWEEEEKRSRFMLVVWVGEEGS